MLNKNIKLSDNRIYGVWEGMKARCYNPNNSAYKRYGGRGIKVCEEWKNNSMSFIEWAYKNGYDDKAKYKQCTLDRIDNNGDYSPENCRWITQKQNSRNMNRCHIVEYQGEKKNWLTWCEELGLSKKAIEHCISRYSLTYPQAFDRYLYQEYNPHTFTWENRKCKKSCG